MTGGTDGTIGQYSDFFDEISKHDYNILCYTGSTSAVTTQFVDFVKAQRDKGVMVQAVVNGSGFDHPAIVNNTIGGATVDYTLTPQEACATMAAIMARQGITGSATNFDVTGWISANPKLNRVQLETRTQRGETLFTEKYGKVMVLYDINSLVNYTEQNPQDFHKNLTIRTLDKYMMDLQKLLDTKAIGKIRNSVTGRNQIKGMIVEMTNEDYVAIDAIEGFTADDVTVSEGNDRDSVVAKVGIKVVDTVDKIYVEVTSL